MASWLLINGWRLAAFAFGADGFEAADVGNLLDGIGPGWALSSKPGTFEVMLVSAKCGV